MAKKSEKPSGGVTNQQLWKYTIILALIVGVLFFSPYLSIIGLSILAVYLTNPIFKRIYKRMPKRKGTAVALTTLASIFLVLIPLIIVAFLAVSQLTSLIDQLNLENVEFGDTSLQEFSVDATEYINEQAENYIGVENLVEESDVNKFLSETLPQVLNAALNLIIGLASSVPAFITNSIIFFFLYTGIMANQDKMIKQVRSISPFNKELDDLYLSRMGSMATAMFKGQFVIAFFQGLTSAASLFFIGLGEYFIFFTILFTFMSLIPLGSGIITMPMGVIAILAGNVAGGVIVLLNHFIVVTNIDNFLRPRLVPEDARLSPAMTLLAVFAGIYYFGLIGVIYGPIIVIVLATTFTTYIHLKDTGQLEKPN